MHFTSFFVFTVLGSFVAAYPAEVPSDAAAPLETRDCSAHIVAYNMARRARRSHDKRSFWWSMRNTTCVTSPDVTGADNWIAGAPVRTDLTEGQAGLSLLMDVGVLDMTTCEPMQNALVEIWGANAMGQYGQTFLRGATTTETNGIAELSTIFPGYTSGAASHLGVKVYPNWSGGSQVTAKSSSYYGRLYFTDSWNRVVGQEAAPYNTNPIPQTLNADDPMWSKANTGGYSAIIDIEEIEDDWPAGVVGYITVGVNPKASVAN